MDQTDLENSKVLQHNHYLACKKASEDGIVFNSPENEERSYTELLERLGGSGKFLDVGCQGGVVYYYIKELGYNYDYYGIEVLEEVAERAIEKGIPNVIVGFMEKMEYPDNYFDVVWCRHVLEHSADIDVVLKEMRRVLKPDGQLGFIVPSVKNDEPAHLVQYEKLEWNYAFIRNGFEISSSYMHDFNLNEYCGVLIVNS